MVLGQGTALLGRKVGTFVGALAADDLDAAVILVRAHREHGADRANRTSAAHDDFVSRGCHPIARTGGVARHVSDHPFRRCPNHLGELGDAARLAAGRVHHQDDAVGAWIIHRRGELLRQHVERSRAGHGGEQVRVPKHRAGDRYQRHTAALGDVAGVLQRPALPGLNGLGAIVFTASDCRDGVQHVRGDRPRFARHQVERRHPMRRWSVGWFIGHGQVRSGRSGFCGNWSSGCDAGMADRPSSMRRFTSSARCSWFSSQSLPS
ncbi:hypothetical protein D3C81_1250160 [compost metagenome]